MTRRWIRIHSVSGLDLCIRVGDVNNKETWNLIVWEK